MSDLFSDVVNPLLGIKPNNLAGGTASKGLTDQSAGTSATNRYTTDYFAGNQVSIWLGDLWLDDVTMVQYNMTQAKRPFYGYASQKYDTLAAGTQIVQGVFAMNYTHTNALNMAIAYYLNKVVSNPAATVTQQQIQQFISDAQSNPALLQNLSYTIGASGNAPTTNPLASNYSSTFNGLNFNDKANLLQDFFWSAPGNVAATQHDVIVADNLPDFDITISFGNYPNERQYGGPDENISSHTVKVLNNVSITGHGIQVGTTGEPVQEVYTFVARGITTPLTRNAQPFAKAANITKSTGSTTSPTTATPGGSVNQ